LGRKPKPSSTQINLNVIGENTMLNEAPNLSQSNFSPEPDEEEADGEVAVPVMLIITSTLFMLVIYAFTHIREINYIRMAPGENASALAGELLGGLAFWFLLLVIIGLVASRMVKPPRRMKLFAIVFAVVGSLGSLGALAAHNIAERNERSRLDQRSKGFSDFLKHSAETQQANPIFAPAPGKDISGVMRDFSSQVMRLRRKHDQDSEQYASALSKLYSADSFSSPAKMRESMQAVDGIQKIDQDFANSFGKTLGELKTRVQASSLSARDKEEFLHGVNHGIGSSEVGATWKDLQKAEDKWSTATHAFYEFALTQSSAIKVVNGHVQIVGEDVRQEFNSRMHECADLSDRVMAASRTMALKQQAGMKNMGVTRSDLGLQK
jgi:hypothetical protein